MARFKPELRPAVRVRQAATGQVWPPAGASRSPELYHPIRFEIDVRRQNTDEPEIRMKGKRKGTAFQRARRRFFNRICRSFRRLRLGLEMANVVVPTLRTFHSLEGGTVFSVDMKPPRSLVSRARNDYTGSFEKAGRLNSGTHSGEFASPSRKTRRPGPQVIERRDHAARRGKARPPPPPRRAVDMRVECFEGRPYWAASIEATSMVSPFRVPVTFTFWPANFSGVF